MSRKAKKRCPPQYAFDYALSFAGENRSQARRLKRLLEAGGRRVFMDEEHQARLVGRDEREFARIYGGESRFFVPLISRHYARKRMPRFEFACATRAAKQRGDDYILPVRLDDTPLVGLSDTTVYLDWRSKPLTVIARTLLAKLGYLDGLGKQPKSSRKRAEYSALLTGERRRLLGLLATALVPLTADVLSKFFPHVNWPGTLRYFSRLGLLITSGDRRRVPHAVVRRLLADHPERRRALDEWVQVFAPLSAHSDIAFFLSIHLWQLGQRVEAVELLARTAPTLDSGTENATYLKMLEALAPRINRVRMPVEVRLQFLNALAICQSRAGQGRNALRVLSRLRRLAHRSDDRQAMATALLNIGVTHFRLGDVESAEKAYRQSVAAARRAGYRLVEAQALGNLSQLVAASNPDEAQQLLRRSLTLKRRLKDHAGYIGAYLALGNIATAAGRSRAARQAYRRSVTLSRRYDRREDLALGLNNWASAEHALGHTGRALDLYREAVAVATEGAFGDAANLASGNLARSQFDSGDYAGAEATYADLGQRLEGAGDTVEFVAARHNQAMAAGRQGGTGQKRAGRLLSQALADAHRIGHAGWQGQCACSLASLLADRGDATGACRLLARVASRVRPMDRVRAAFLLVEAGDIAVSGDLLPTRARTLYRRARTVIEQAGRNAEVTQMRALVAERLSESGKALVLWRRCARQAEQIRHRELLLEALLHQADLTLAALDLAACGTALAEAEAVAAAPLETAAVSLRQLRVLLAQADTRTAERLFGRLVRLCRRHALRAICIDAHMAVGDYYLSQGNRRLLAACKAYTAALSEAIEVGVPTAIDIGAHTATYLHGLYIAGKTRTVQHVHEAIGRWLEKSCEGEGSAAVIAWLQWPFRVARRLAHLGTDQTEITVGRVGSIIRAEFFSSPAAE